MFPRQPNHPSALGLNAAGPLALIPEQLPKTSNGISALEQLLYPTSGGAPFTLKAHGTLTNNKQLTLNPIVTGSSVIAVKYRDGVVIAADTAASYGSTMRFKDVKRIHKVNDICLIGAGGEVSDFSYIQELLEEFSADDFCADDGIIMSPSEVHSILCRVLYNRRTKMDPLWNSIVIGGLQDGKPFLGSVGMIGTHYVDDHICTGFGNHLCRPLFREQYRPDATKEETIKLVETCLRVAYYRDSSTMNKYQIAVCNAEGIAISEPYALDTTWNYERFVSSNGNAPGLW